MQRAVELCFAASAYANGDFVQFCTRIPALAGPHVLRAFERLSFHVLQPECCYSAEANSHYRVRLLGSPVYVVYQSVQVSPMAACVIRWAAFSSQAVRQTSRSHEDLRRLFVCAALFKRHPVSPHRWMAVQQWEWCLILLVTVNKSRSGHRVVGGNLA